MQRGTATLFGLVAPCVAIGALANTGQGATINVGAGDDPIGPDYQLGIFINTQTEAANIVATSGSGALAFENFNVADPGGSTDGGVVGKASGNMAVIPDPSSTNSDGSINRVIYHFQPDAGVRITAASVDSNAWLTNGPGGDNAQNSVTGYWSIDNATYERFLRVDGGSAEEAADFIDLATKGFTQGQDLYLRYDLTRHDGGTFPQGTQLFRSDAGSDLDGFHVNLELAPIPEPASLAFLGVGGMILLGRRRPHAGG